MTGPPHEEGRRQSNEAGLDRHFIKPIGRATLEELINGLAIRK
jgi:hypothetical protein